MKKIPVSGGLFAIVDNDLFEALCKLGPWVQEKSPNKKITYARRHCYSDGKHTAELMHRAIFRLKGIKLPPKLDHIDFDGLNNQLHNLRPATSAQNGQHCRKRKGSSRFKNVTHRTDNGKWRAYIQVGGKKKFLGQFSTEEQAALAYNEAAASHYGPFAVFNKV
jgi:hypothetical protein